MNDQDLAEFKSTVHNELLSLRSRTEELGHYVNTLVDIEQWRNERADIFSKIFFAIASSFGFYMVVYFVVKMLFR